MPHNPRHKPRFSNLVPRTSVSPRAGMYQSDVGFTIDLKEEMAAELKRRKLVAEQRALAEAARKAKSKAEADRHLERIAELEKRKQEFLAAEAKRKADRQAKREETGGAAPSLDAVKAALSTATANNPTAQAALQAQRREQMEELDSMIPPSESAEPQTEGFDLLSAISEGGISLSPGSASQVGVSEVGQDLIQKRVDAVQQNTLPPDLAQQLAVTQADTTTPAAPQFAPPDLDEQAVRGPLRGPWEEDKAADDKKKEQAAQEEKSTVNGSEDIPDATRAALERTWGKWAYNPRQRRDRYMEQLNSIYRKGAWLDAIAALTGNPSRSGAYIQRAVAKMEAMQMFDQEERIYNIWRDVYFAPDGTYDPPANKAEAARRARRLGASPQEVKKIYGWTEEEPDLQQWYRVVDGELETTQTKGKKVKPKGDGWIMGTPPSGLQTGTAVSHINWTDGDRTITLEKGQTPQSVGHTGDWWKGKAAEPGKVPGGEDDIDFMENVYANAGYGEAGRAAAVQALKARMRKNPEMYGIIGQFIDDQHTLTAERMIKAWIDAYEARGRTPYSEQGRRAVGVTETVSLGAID